jgi:hypothetical protein
MTIDSCLQETWTVIRIIAYTSIKNYEKTEQTYSNHFVQKSFDQLDFRTNKMQANNTHPCLHKFQVKNEMLEEVIIMTFKGIHLIGWSDIILTLVYYCFIPTKN